MSTTLIDTHQAAIEHDLGLNGQAEATLVITCPVTGEAEAAEAQAVVDVSPWDGAPIEMDGICTGCGGWVQVGPDGTSEVLV